MTDLRDQQSVQVCMLVQLLIQRCDHLCISDRIQLVCNCRKQIKETVFVILKIDLIILHIQCPDIQFSEILHKVFMTPVVGITKDPQHSCLILKLRLRVGTDDLISQCKELFLILKVIHDPHDLICLTVAAYLQPCAEDHIDHKQHKDKIHNNFLPFHYTTLYFP